jgi:ribose transport system substrate-binding protein
LTQESRAASAGAITQNPIGNAATSRPSAPPPPKIIDTGFYWYDKTNIDDLKFAAVLYD